MAVIVYNIEFGYWVCGGSWLAIKDSLTHRPGSQGRAPKCPALMSCHVYLCMCVLYGYFGVCEYGGGGFLYLSMAMNYNFM